MTSRPGRRYAGSVVTSQLRSELDRLVQEVLAARETASRSSWTPAVDVLDCGDQLLVLLAVPGLAAADLHVEAEGNMLRIRGRRRLAFANPGRLRFHCLERQEGAFERHLEIAQPVDFQRARLRLADGLLRIELPKIEERRRRVHHLPIEESDEP